jgi:ABC-type Na+ transport system ATPase subunit NatA
MNEALFVASIVIVLQAGKVIEQGNHAPPSRRPLRRALQHLFPA